jgi:hypothetical protein
VGLSKGVCHERQQGQVASSLDRLGQLSLVLRGGTGDPAWQNLALVVNEASENLNVLVVDVFYAGLSEEALAFLSALTCRRYVAYERLPLSSLS